MKTKLMIMILILTVSSISYAGECEHQKGEGHRGENHKGQNHKGRQFKQRRMQELNLSEAQQESFDAIMKTKRESMKAAMDVIHLDTQAELAKVLSAEQMQMMEAKKQQRQEKGEKRKERKMEKRALKQKS